MSSAVPVPIPAALPKLINRGMNWITHLGQLWVSGIGGVWLLGAIEISGARYTRVHVPVQLVKSKSCSVVSDSLRPHGLYSPWNSPSQNAGVGSHSLLLGIFPNPGIEPRSPALQAGSLPIEWLGKSKNTGEGSLSLLQQIFLIQKLNWGLLHCRWFFTSWATREALGCKFNRK